MGGLMADSETETVMSAMCTLEAAHRRWGSATLHRGGPRVDVRAAELARESEALLAEAERTLRQAALAPRLGHDPEQAGPTEQADLTEQDAAV